MAAMIVGYQVLYHGGVSISDKAVQMEVYAVLYRAQGGTEVFPSAWVVSNSIV